MARLKSKKTNCIQRGKISDQLIADLNYWRSLWIEADIQHKRQDKQNAEKMLNFFLDKYNAGKDYGKV